MRYRHHSPLTTLQFSMQKLECLDTDQEIAKLPPPFIFGEGIRGKSRKNATCLDYKARWGLQLV